MRSAYLTLTLDTAEDAERVYALLCEGGQIFMKMEETAFASRFAQLRDRFGTSWMLLHERSAAKPIASADIGALEYLPRPHSLANPRTSKLL